MGSLSAKLLQFLVNAFESFTRTVIMVWRMVCMWFAYIFQITLLYIALFTKPSQILFIDVSLNFEKSKRGHACFFLFRNFGTCFGIGVIH